MSDIGKVGKGGRKKGGRPKKKQTAEDKQLETREKNKKSKANETLTIKKELGKSSILFVIPKTGRFRLRLPSVTDPESGMDLPHTGLSNPGDVGSPMPDIDDFPQANGGSKKSETVASDEDIDLDLEDSGDNLPGEDDGLDATDQEPPDQEPPAEPNPGPPGVGEADPGDADNSAAQPRVVPPPDQPTARRLNDFFMQSFFCRFCVLQLMQILDPSEFPFLERFYRSQDLRIDERIKKISLESVVFKQKLEPLFGPPDADGYYWVSHPLIPLAMDIQEQIFTFSGETPQIFFVLQENLMAAYVSCPALLIRFLNANFSCVVDGHSEELCYPGPGTGNDDDDEQSQPPIKKYLELLGRIDCRKYPPITYTNTWRKKDIANKLLEPLKLPLYQSGLLSGVESGMPTSWLSIP